MTIRNRPERGRLALVTIVVSFGMAVAGVTPSFAGTYGTGGPIDSVDLTEGTIEVNGHTIYVTSQSVMRDPMGQRVRMEELDRINLPVGVSMVKVGRRYVLRELVFISDDQEE